MGNSDRPILFNHIGKGQEAMSDKPIIVPMREYYAAQKLIKWMEERRAEIARQLAELMAEEKSIDEHIATAIELAKSELLKQGWIPPPPKDQTTKA